MGRYTYHLIFSFEPGGFSGWEILDMEVRRWEFGNKEAVVAQFPYNETEDDNSGRPPIALRRRYEELLGRGEFLDEDTHGEPAINIVEFIADQDDSAFDQPCAFGYRVETHAVYCHNDKWLYAPRKCHRSTEWPWQECPGFLAYPIEKFQ